MLAKFGKRIAIGIMIGTMATSSVATTTAVAAQKKVYTIDYIQYNAKQHLKRTWYKLGGAVPYIGKQNFQNHTWKRTSKNWVRCTKCGCIKRK